MPPDNREIRVNRIKQITCASCKHVIDITVYKPLSRQPCPNCGEAFEVPCQIGQYLLFKRLAAGAMGSVYKAYDEVLARQVALKIVSAPPSKDDDLYQGALREARVQGSINHPCVAQVYAMSEDMGQPYIIMELIEGGSVLSMIKDQGPIDEQHAIQLVTDAARGLDAGLKLGLMHRDVKPGNLLVTREGRAKLIDFGLAERVSKQTDGKVVGSPYYMSPEIARGQVADQRADIYSLGASLYHMLTGEPPFKKQGASARDIVLRRFKIPPPDPCQLVGLLQKDTAKLCQMMMALEPDDRPGDYDDLIRRLRQLAALLRRDEPRAEPPLAQAPRAQSKSKRDDDDEPVDPDDALRALSDALDD